MVWTDATMYPFDVISRRSTPEIVLSYELEESEDEKAKLDDNIIRK